MLKPRAAKILSRPEDVHCVVYHLLVVAAYGLAFWIYFYPTRFGLRGRAEVGAFIAVGIVMIGWVAAVDVGVNFHNHVHRPIFRSTWLNRWFGRFWTVTGGWPSFLWWYAHIVVHHAHLLDRSDWTLPRRCPDGSHEGLYSYCLRHWPWRYAAGFWQEFRGARGRRHAGTAAREIAIFLALWSIPWWIDPWMGLFLWLLPQWFGNVVVMGAGMYVQHVHCVPKTDALPVAHSNTFACRFFNLIMFNIGFHNEHHDHPNVHWSDLPALHEELRPALIRGRAHVIPNGYYWAAWNIARMGVRRDSVDGPPAYLYQHPDYVPLGDGAAGEVGPPA